jgi:hypothetical protein
MGFGYYYNKQNKHPEQQSGEIFYTNVSCRKHLKKYEEDDDYRIGEIAYDVFGNIYKGGIPIFKKTKKRRQDKLIGILFGDETFRHIHKMYLELLLKYNYLPETKGDLVEHFNEISYGLYLLVIKTIQNDEEKDKMKDYIFLSKTEVFFDNEVTIFLNDYPNLKSEFIYLDNKKEIIK